VAKTSNHNANNGNGLYSSAPNCSALLTTSEDLLRSITNRLSQIITIKLEEDNFLLWKFQLKNIIMGNGLEDFIHGTCDVPPRLIAGEANPAYVRNQRQDKLLIS